MEENKEGTQQAAQEAYVRQLAELSARVLHMTEEQKQRNAAKIEELNKRVAALPSALRGLYAQKLRSLAPQAAPVQQPPAADAAYEPEYADGSYAASAAGGCCTGAACGAGASGANERSF